MKFPNCKNAPLLSRIAPRRPKLTILTNPILWRENLWREAVRRVGRPVKLALRPNTAHLDHPTYLGHVGVTRSLVEGLITMGASFNYNPHFTWQLADTAVVLAGYKSLEQAIKLKRHGYIKRLYAGPNVVVFSSDYDSLIASPFIDGVITPSSWVVDLYLEDNPSLIDRIFTWPAGVDTIYWQADPSRKRDTILVYEKQNKGIVGPIEPYVNYMRELGWAVNVIRYGSFTHDSYREMLRQSCLMVGFVVCESQGLAWAEAWSCDVPTLIWRNTSNTYQGRKYRNSTAPYLIEQNGLFFDDFESFKVQFVHWEERRNLFMPRQYVLEKMSDEVCASMLYSRIT